MYFLSSPKRCSSDKKYGRNKYGKKVATAGFKRTTNGSIIFNETPNEPKKKHKIKK